jgi:hypothetical protein
MGIKLIYAGIKKAETPILENIDYNSTQETNINPVEIQQPEKKDETIETKETIEPVEKEETSKATSTGIHKTDKEEYKDIMREIDSLILPTIKDSFVETLKEEYSQDENAQSFFDQWIDRGDIVPSDLKTRIMSLSVDDKEKVKNYVVKEYTSGKSMQTFMMLNGLKNSTKIKALFQNSLSDYMSILEASPEKQKQAIDKIMDNATVAQKKWWNGLNPTQRQNILGDITETLRGMIASKNEQESVLDSYQNEMKKRLKEIESKSAPTFKGFMNTVFVTPLVGALKQWAGLSEPNAQANRKLDWKTIKEGSLIDYPHKSLPMDLFDKKGQSFTLKPDINKQIVDTIYSVVDRQFLGRDVWLKGLLLGGSALSQFYNSTSDLDVKVIFDPKSFVEENDSFENFEKESYDELKKEMVKSIREVQEDFIVGIRPVDIFFYSEDEVNDKSFDENYDSIYDLLNGNWMKPPTLIDIKKIDRESFLKDAKESAITWANEFDKSISGIKRAILDYCMIKDYMTDMDKEEIKLVKQGIEETFETIKDEIETLKEGKDIIVEDRHRIFSKPISEFETVFGSLQSKNASQENLVFKYVQYWKYFTLIRDLDAFIADDNEITEEEIEPIEDIIKENN